MITDTVFRYNCSIPELKTVDHRCPDASRCNTAHQNHRINFLFDQKRYDGCLEKYRCPGLAHFDVIGGIVNSGIQFRARVAVDQIFTNRTHFPVRHILKRFVGRITSSDRHLAAPRDVQQARSVVDSPVDQGRAPSGYFSSVKAVWKSTTTMAGRSP